MDKRTMSKHYNALPSVNLDAKNRYEPLLNFPELLHLEDPATDIMVDFNVIQPPVTHPRETIAGVLSAIKGSAIHVLLVLENNHVVGLISAEDVLGEKPLRISQERRVSHEQIHVHAVMTPSEHILAIDYKELRAAKIGHVLETFKDQQKHYLLAVETDEDGAQKIRGVIYIYDIVKRLNKDLVLELREARSLLELRQDLQF